MSLKAKLYVHEDKMEIRFIEDNTLYMPKKGEAKDKFIERIKKIALDEYLEDEFDLTEIDKEVVATNTDEALKEAVTTAESLQKKIIEAVLTDRGILKGKAPKKDKLEPQTAEEMKETEHYKECEANIGKFAKFSPHKKPDVYEGKIAGVALNKTNTIVYYTIVESDGKRRCCAAKNETLTFIEKPEGFKEEKKKEDKKETKSDAKTSETGKPSGTEKGTTGDAQNDAGDADNEELT